MYAKYQGLCEQTKTDPREPFLCWVLDLLTKGLSWNVVLVLSTERINIADLDQSTTE